MAQQKWRGRLLVATPALVDPNFGRTVVLLLEHSPDGAVGVVLNRPSDRTVAELLPAWAEAVAEPGLVMIGGPVERQALIGLGCPSGLAGPVVDDCGPVDLADPSLLGPERVRVFAGYAGWGSGQLEREVEQGAWFVVRAEGGDCWHPRPRELWREVLRRQRGVVRLFASFPDDAALN